MERTNLPGWVRKARTLDGRASILSSRSQVRQESRILNGREAEHTKLPGCVSNTRLKKARTLDGRASNTRLKRREESLYTKQAKGDSELNLPYSGRVTGFKGLRA